MIVPQCSSRRASLTGERRRPAVCLLQPVLATVLCSGSTDRSLVGLPPAAASVAGAVMRRLVIVVMESGVEVGLERPDALAGLLAHSWPKEIPDHRAVEALDEAASGIRAPAAPPSNRPMADGSRTSPGRSPGGMPADATASALDERRHVGFAVRPSEEQQVSLPMLDLVTPADRDGTLLDGSPVRDFTSCSSTAENRLRRISR